MLLLILLTGKICGVDKKCCTLVNNVVPLVVANAFCLMYNLRRYEIKLKSEMSIIVIQSIKSFTTYMYSIIIMHNNLLRTSVLKGKITQTIILCYTILDTSQNVQDCLGR